MPSSVMVTASAVAARARVTWQWRARVPDDIGDRLDHDAVRGDLDRGRERGQVVTGVHAGGKTGLAGQPLDGLGAGGGEAEFVERRRAQPFDEAPDVHDRVADLLGQVVQPPRCAIGAGREQRPRGLGLQRQRPQID